MENKLLKLPICILSLMLTSGWPSYGVLTLQDIVDQKFQTHPKLSAGMGEQPYWQSFNQWRCFKSEQINTTCFRCDGSSCANVSEDPGITAVDDDKIYEFDFEEPPSNVSCQEIISKWKNVLANQREVCIYAAYLQEIDAVEGQRHTLWILSKVKTKADTWTEDTEFE